MPPRATTTARMSESDLDGHGITAGYDTADLDLRFAVGLTPKKPFPTERR